MTAKLLLRVASGAIAFFFIGHSMGHFMRHQESDPRAREILDQMSGYKLNMFGTLRSYDENYTGMSFNLLLTLFAFAVLLWILAGLCEGYGALCRRLLWPIAICVGGFAVTSWLYFFPVPAITCAVSFGCIFWAMVKLRSERSPSF